MENFNFYAVHFAVVLINFIPMFLFILMFSIILQIFRQINSFQASGLFLYPLKTSDNLCFPHIFREYVKGPMD